MRAWRAIPQWERDPGVEGLLKADDDVQSAILDSIAQRDPRDLRGFRSADTTRRRAQFVDRHIGYRQLRQQVIAPLRGMVGDLGERALALPAGARLCFQSRRNAVGRSDGGFAGISFGRH
jgi:hypothetical protein